MIFRLLFVTLVSFSSLFACSGGISICKKKADDAAIFQKGVVALSLSGNQLLIFSQNSPKSFHILKRDPLLSLYLVSNPKPFAYPFVLNNNASQKLFIVTKKGSCAGSITKKQKGLDTFAKWEPLISKEGIITTACCFVEGIVTPKGVISKAYIHHFMQAKCSEVFYGDVGIRLREGHGRVIVEYCDPFYAKNPFKKGDTLLLINNKSYKSAAKAMQKILFAKAGERLHFVVLREGKKQKVTAVVSKRYGGGFVSDTFLEREGLFFDEQLRLKRLRNSFKNYGLLPGDRLIQIEQRRVHTQEDIRSYFQNHRSFKNLLFERNGFEFFIHLHSSKTTLL